MRIKINPKGAPIDFALRTDDPAEVPKMLAHAARLEAESAFDRPDVQVAIEHWHVARNRYHFLRTDRRVKRERTLAALDVFKIRRRDLDALLGLPHG